MKHLAAAVLSIALGACAGNPDTSTSTADDDQLLNNAAAMLDANSVAANAPSAATTGNQR